MSKFKDRLWRELMRDHGADLAQLGAPGEDRNRRTRPRVLAGTSLGLAGVGTIVALILGAAGSSPAFAVTKNRDGTVSVTISKLDGIRGANARLAAIGVHAVAVPVEAGCAVGPPPPALRAALLKARAIAAAGGPRTVQINPNGIPAGKRLVLAAGANWVRVAQLHGAGRASPPCFREIVAPAWCHVAGGPPGSGTITTDTSGASTAPPPPTDTNTNTTTTGTTTGATTGPVPGPSTRFAGCPPPPCAAVRAGVQVVPPGGPSTNTTTTGTTTAPPTDTTTTDTTTTDTTTTDTTTGPVATPVPTRRFIGCSPPCAFGQVHAGAGPGAITSDRAKLAKMRAALARARAALASARAAWARAANAKLRAAKAKP